MIDKSKYICSTPFNHTEVHDDKQFLCCPSWLPTNVSDGNGILSSFNSEKSKEIKESILDGSYRYCNEVRCPFLARLKSNEIPTNFIPKTPESIKESKEITHPTIVNFCFDRSCNFQCPSCRNELINYTGNQRISVDVKLKEVEEEISPYIHRLHLSGSADPFYSKSFRQFLINLDAKKFKKLKSIHLHTNASLWTETMWDKMRAIHRYVKSCEISIDASTKETYENKTRIGGNWDVLIENLHFITKISTIRHYIFSFVVQDTNYTEMFDFYKLIESYMKIRVDKIKWEVKTAVIVNWGTYRSDVFKQKDVSNPSHINHKNFLIELDKIKAFPNIVHNFHHLYEVENKLI